MKRTNYLYAMAKYLTSLFTFIPSNPETTKGYTATGNFSRFYGCKKYYNKKAKGLAIEKRHHRRKIWAKASGEK